MRLFFIFLIVTNLFFHTQAIAQPPEKPRKRSDAEDKQKNLDRYVLGGFGQNATASLGIKVIYSDDPPMVTLSSFLTDSTAEAAGLEEYDWIIEVDGSAVGKIRGRYYEPWQKYGRSGKDKTELLVAYNTASGRKYYYPKVNTQVVAGTVSESIEREGFTISKPRQRSSPEDASIQFSRYQVDPNNFKKYSPYELGAVVEYSYGRGAIIKSVVSGSPADKIGLKQGDMILEVDGAPIGVFDGRTYEVWQQYKYSKDDKVELLVAFDRPDGSTGYFYPEVTLNPHQTEN